MNIEHTCLACLDRDTQGDQTPCNTCSNICYYIKPIRPLDNNIEYTDNWRQRPV